MTTIPLFGKIMIKMCRESYKMVKFSANSMIVGFFEIGNFKVNLLFSKHYMHAYDGNCKFEKKTWYNRFSLQLVYLQEFFDISIPNHSPRMIIQS